MSTAVEIARWAMGGFFATALVTGVWKYAHIRHTEEGSASAPVYVDIAHRAAFMYAFSCMLMERFAELSKWPDWVNTWAMAVAVGFFASAISTYILHGFLRDTDNQLAVPHTLGKGTMPRGLVLGYMVALTVGEIGGFAVIFSGAMLA